MPRSPSRPQASPRATLAAALLAVVCLAGCRGLPLFGPHLAQLPEDHVIEVANFHLVSDHEISEDSPLVQDLLALRQQVTSTLNLPEPSRPVTVYLFSDRQGYRQYLDQTYPGLPDRRAYFVGSPGELAIYTYWGERIREDLRHEATHGILHASLTNVPLWLDEGLAEYFEVPPSAAQLNGDYPQQLARAVTTGWRPNLERLERIEQFAALGRIDYQESWAWVHYLLHASPETHRQLLTFLADLQETETPKSLSKRLAQAIPSYHQRFLSYLGNLGGPAAPAVIRASSTAL